MPKAQTPISGREQDRRRKEAVTSSAAFQEWFEARRMISPRPNSYYRAYMIDIGIPARTTDRPTWRKIPNRSDVEIDYPTYYRKGGFTPPTRKPRTRPRKAKTKYPRRKRRELPTYKPAELTKMEKHFQGLAEKFAEHYHVPVPKVIIAKSPVGTSYAKTGFAYEYGTGRVFQRSEPIIVLGGKSLWKKPEKVASFMPMELAAFYHEMGHHAHAWIGSKVVGGVTVATSGYGRKTAEAKIVGERKAWKLAQPFLPKKGKAVAKWTQKFYLGTYLGTSPTEKKRKRQSPVIRSRLLAGLPKQQKKKKRGRKNQLPSWLI